MSTNNSVIKINNYTVESVEKYVYLKHNIKLGKENQIPKITRRIGLTWTAFGKLSYILEYP